MIFILLTAGLIILFYPTVSNWLSDRKHAEAVTHYDTELKKMEEAEIQSQLEEARTYNNALTGQDIEDPFIPESGMVLPENYVSILDIDDGMMGYLEIPDIEVNLPIYHGTGNEVLEEGVGHMEMTAFPIGGEGNHSVLTGHTALPGAKLFSDLVDVEEGDVFYITILKETLAYEVDQIKVIEPSDTSDLKPVTGEDYVTLVTCTPYGINSHRLLVRGSRIPYTPEISASEEETVISKYGYSLIVAVSALIIVLLILLVFFINKRRRRRKDQ